MDPGCRTAVFAGVGSIEENTMPRRPQVSNPPANDKHQRFSDHQPDEQRQDDYDVDAMSEDSFPASDPPSIGSVRTGRPERQQEKRQRQQKLKKSTPHSGTA
jgi:hypothetical protein